MLKGNKYYWIFFSVLILVYSSVLIYFFRPRDEKPDKCYNPVTWEGELSDDGTINVNNVTISSDYFNKINATHFRVCLHDKLPVLRKCCMRGQRLNYKPTKCINHGKDDFENSLKIYDENDSLIENYNKSNFYWEYGMVWCPHKKFHCSSKKKKNEEQMKFRKNAEILCKFNDTVSGIVNSDEFCLDWIEKDNRTHIGAWLCKPQTETELEKEKETKFLEETTTLYFYGLMFSIPFLLSTFVCHLLIEELRTLHGLFVMCYVASLITFYVFLDVSFLPNVIEKYTHPKLFCTICGYMIQFSSLSSFFWLNVMCTEMWWSFRNLRSISRGSPKSKVKKFIFSCCYAWGCPGIILCITLMMDRIPGIIDDHRPKVGEKLCFIDTESRRVAFYYLYGPIGFVLIINLCLFLLTAVKIFLTRKQTQMLNRPESGRSVEESKRFVVYFKLFIIMGIGWFIEFLSWAVEDPKKLWFALNFSNSLQGLFIFALFLPKIIKVVKKRIGQKFSQSNTDFSDFQSVGSAKSRLQLKPL